MDERIRRRKAKCQKLSETGANQITHSLNLMILGFDISMTSNSAFDWS